MTRKWSKKFEQCQQCGTARYNHVAKGLCTRCYRLVKKLEQVSQWDLSNPASFKGYKGYIEGRTYCSAEKFERIQSGVSREIRKRLEFLQGREETLKGPIYGLDLEFQLARIALRCGVKKDLFHGLATYIDHSFNMKQKKILYELLNDIEENILWAGIDWVMVYLSARSKDS